MSTCVEYRPVSQSSPSCPVIFYNTLPNLMMEALNDVEDVWVTCTVTPGKCNEIWIRLKGRYCLNLKLLLKMQESLKHTCCMSSGLLNDVIEIYTISRHGLVAYCPTARYSQGPAEQQILVKKLIVHSFWERISDH